MKRVCVVGTTGSGKTTIGRRLAHLLRCRHLELDSFYWGPDWTPRETSHFSSDVQAAVAGECWVADGNYHAVRDLVWNRADTLVWLDYTIGTVLVRLARRTIRRAVTREELWHGNRDRLLDHLATRKSLFLWALQTHWRRRRTYGRLLAAQEYPQLSVRRFLSPMEAEEWLSGIDVGSRPEPTEGDARHSDR